MHINSATSFLLIIQVPETSQSFSLELRGVTGGARLSDDAAQLRSNLIIVQNDDPVSFAPPFTQIVPENSTVTLTILRQGRENGIVEVTYGTRSGTAVAGQDFVGLTNETVTFVNGQTSTTITVDLIDDGTPERTESFTVVLLSVTGKFKQI